MSEAFIPKERYESWKRWSLSSLGSEGAAEAGRDAGADRQAAERKAISTVREAARAEGFQAGYREGAERAKAEASRLAALTAAAQAALGRLEHDLGEELLQVALEIARQVLRNELTLRRDALLPVVREAIAALPQNAGPAQLMLNPGDVELVRAHIGDELAAGSFRVVEDHRIEPGGCRIQSQSCEVDATIATRWRRMLQTLGREGGKLDG
jgi:flagellar assembly protein FliH